MMVRDSITRTEARTPGAEGDPPSMAVHDRVLGPTQCIAFVQAEQEKWKPVLELIANKTK